MPKFFGKKKDNKDEHKDKNAQADFPKYHPGDQVLVVINQGEPAVCCVITGEYLVNGERRGHWMVKQATGAWNTTVVQEDQMTMLQRASRRS